MTLPTGLGGDLFKVLLVKKYTGMIRSLRVCFLDRFIGFLTIWFFWTIFFGFYYSFFNNKTFFLMLLFNLATWFIFFITIKFNKNLYFRFKFINWLILIVKDFVRIKKFKNSLDQICVAICIYFVTVLSLIMVGKSININISIFDYFIIFAIDFISSTDTNFNWWLGNKRKYNDFNIKLSKYFNRTIFFFIFIIWLNYFFNLFNPCYIYVKNLVYIDKIQDFTKIKKYCKIIKISISLKDFSITNVKFFFVKFF